MPEAAAGIESEKVLDGGAPRPQGARMAITILSPVERDRMRRAGRAAAATLAHVGARLVPGMTTSEIDRLVRAHTEAQGGRPSQLGYHGFPAAVCVSRNDVVCHGVPSPHVRLADGDIVNVDVTAYFEGVHGDTNATFFAGDVSQEHRDLVARTLEATMRGIKAIRPGREINVIGRVIESYAKRFGYNVVRDFTGHGVGPTFHNGLIVLHYDTDGDHQQLEPGMTLTVEPMINLGELAYEVWDDDWTVTTRDKKWTAQFEHTIVVTEDSYEILTVPSGGIEAFGPEL